MTQTTRIALQLASYLDPSTGVPAPTATAQITLVTIDPINRIVDIKVQVWYSIQTLTGGGQPMAEFHFYPPYAMVDAGKLSSPDAFYRYLLTLPMFAGAQQVTY